LPSNITVGDTVAADVSNVGVIAVVAADYDALPLLVPPLLLPSMVPSMMPLMLPLLLLC
jgi:hypothetical protein